jgi:hypothetical protein
MEYDIERGNAVIKWHDAWRCLAPTIGPSFNGRENESKTYE